MPNLSFFEALRTLAHRGAISENERKDLEAAFLEAAGTDDEKKQFYTESDSDKAARLKKEEFEAAVAAEVARRGNAAADTKAISEAADKAQQGAN